MHNHAKHHADARPTPRAEKADTAEVSPQRRASDTPDAITLLIEDHQVQTRLFKQYEKLIKAEAKAEERETLAADICRELLIHMQIEDEILYPAARRGQVDSGLIDEATVEHQTGRELIEQIMAMRGNDALYDAKVKVLSEYMEHHIKEEQDDLFPKCRRRIDIQQIGAALKQRKEELLAAWPMSTVMN